MPFVDPRGVDPGGVDLSAGPGPLIRLPSAEERSPDAWSVLGAAFRQGNSLVSAATGEPVATDLYRPIDPAFDPFAELEERYRPYARAFLQANSREEVARVKAAIDRELEDRRTLGAAGFGGLVAAFAAGLTDPLQFVPVAGKAFRGFALARDIQLARRSAIGALEVARAGAIGAAAAEAGLQATQITRTPEESIEAIGMATALSGVLGAAIPAVREAWSALRRARQGRSEPLEPAIAREVTPAPAGAADALEPGTIRITPEEAPPPVREAPVREAPIREGPVPEEAGPAPRGGEPVPSRIEAPVERAYTARGRAIETRLDVVEAAELVPSHTQELAINPAFPQALQPRDRSRAASAAQVQDIAANLNPELLARSASAAEGAPIIGPDMLVESGNARVLAIARAYAQSLPSAEGYRAFLASQGFDVQGMAAPVLVRRRVSELDAEARLAFVREANERMTAEMAAPERARADAGQLDEGLLDLHRGGEVGLARNRDFVRGFIDRVVAPAERGGLIDAEGALSQAGQRRIEAALLARAYENPRLTALLAEATDSNVKRIAGALLDAAPEWARMRAKPGLPPELDITRDLTAAVDLVRKARDERAKLADLAQQSDLFGGGPSARAKALLPLFFRDRRFTREAGRETIADRLRFYATEAAKAEAGPKLFEALERIEPEDILAQLARKEGRDGAQGDQGGGARQPGQAQGDLLSGARGGPADGQGDRGGGPPGSRPAEPGARPADAGAGDQPPPDEPGSDAGDLAPPSGGGGSLSAASPDEANLFERLKSAFRIERAIAFTNPLLRLATSPSIKARRYAAELAETPFAYEKNALGLASPVAAETMVKLWQAPLGQALQATDAAFLRYRQARSLAATGLRDLAGAAKAEGRLAYHEFREAVGQAMRRGDRHDIPEVAEAAREWRSRVFDPLKDRAIEAGLLPEDVGVETAVSYLSRVYNLEKLKARRPDFVRIATGYLERSQAEKAGIQARIRQLDDELDGWEDMLAKVEGRLETLARRETTTGAKREEAHQAAGGAVRRSIELGDRQAEARGRIRDINREIRRLELQRRRAPAEAQPDLAGQRAGEAQLRELMAERRALREELYGQMGRRRIQGGEAEVARNRLANRAGVLAERLDGIGYDKAKLEAYRERLVDIVGTTEMEIAAEVERWPGRSRTARQILNRATDLTAAELEDEAQKIADHILGHPGGRNPYEGYSPADPERRGPLMQRVFAIEDAAIEEFLESDIELIGRFYVRTMAPDVELARRFGDIGMTRPLEDLRASYVPLLREAENDIAYKRLEARRKSDIRDLEAMRDRLRGLYQAPSDPDSPWLRAGRIIRDLNYLRLMGGMTISAIPDLGRAVMVEGFGRVMGDGVAAMAGNWQAFKLAAREVRLAGTALDLVLDTRAMSLADIGDDFGRHSAFERGLRAATHRFGLVSLMAPWNTAIKQFAGVVVQARILDAAEAWTRGAVSAADRERLAIGGIDEGMAGRIAAQFREHGELRGTVRLANTPAWTDQAAATAFRAALNKDVDRIIVTPGIGDRPLWMSSPWGQVIGQFKAFAFASTQRVALAGLQQRDAAALNGALLMLGLGMGTYAIRQGIREDGKLSDNPAVWIAEGVDKSGLTGFLFDVNNIIEKTTGGTFGVNALTGGPPMDRYASRNVMGAVFGPTVGLTTDAARIIGAASNLDWNAGDTRAARRMLPLQNLFYLRWLLDQAEHGINETFGIRKAEPKRRKAA